MKGCLNYEMLGLIFNPLTIIEILHHSSTRTSPNSDKDEELNEALLQFGIHVS